jgi:threonine dehydratase
MIPPTDTPLIRLGNLFPDRPVFAKCEFLAPSGSFKIHGAGHLLRHLSRAGHTRQLVVPSMGNTALGVAVAAPAFGFRVTGVVPRGIGRAKDEKLRALGVELIKLDHGGGSELLHTAQRLADERAAYFVHPHLDPLWTDGYGVIVEQVLRALPGCRSLVFPVGGGGLLMGITDYLRERPAPVKLVGCEPYNFPTYARYSHARSATVADGLVLDEPHAKVRERIDELGLPICLVADAAIRMAMSELYAKHGLVVEPSSAITLAFVKEHVGELEDPVCVILTGGNIAREDFDRLTRTDAATG